MNSTVGRKGVSGFNTPVDDLKVLKLVSTDTGKEFVEIRKKKENTFRSTMTLYRRLPSNFSGFIYLLIEKVREEAARNENEIYELMAYAESCSAMASLSTEDNRIIRSKNFDIFTDIVKIIMIFRSDMGKKRFSCCMKNILADLCEVWPIEIRELDIKFSSAEKSNISYKQRKNTKGPCLFRD